MNIFDPLSVIIKLAILSKKSIGSKISIKNYILIIQEFTYTQGILRYFNNDNKFDIINLLYPIHLACKIYLDVNNNNSLNMKLLFRTAQNGISILINTYNNYPIIKYTLKYANIIIEIYINNLLKFEIYNKHKFNIIMLQNSIDDIKNISSSQYISQNSISRNSLSRKSLSSNSLFSELIKSPSSSTICLDNEEIITNNKFYRNSSLTNLLCEKEQNNINKSLKSIVYRYGSTGYFSFDNNYSEIDYNNILEIINKIDYYNNLIFNNNIIIYDEYNKSYSEKIINEFKNFWNTNSRLKNILYLVNNYINLNIFKIETYMNEIDDLITIIILNNNFSMN